MADTIQKFDVKNLQPGCFFSSDLFLDEGFILTAPETRLPQGIIDALSAWQFTGVQSAGQPTDSFQGTSREQHEFTQNDAENVQQAGQFYLNLQAWAGELFEEFTVKQRVRFNDIAEKIKEIISEINKSRRFLLQVQKDVEEVSDENFLISHAVKCTIIALVIGQTLKLPIHRLIELGSAALLHEIGMILIPARFYLARGDLGPAEKEAINSHPALGYDLLRANSFPLSVCIPALEHHERENGSGYPSKLNGNGIGLYSKIIAVVCSYEAITTRRPHKSAQDGYHGMLQLIRNENKQYDDAVLNALVRSLSLFPIGLYVMLSNGKKAQVVDANPADPRSPIVQVFEEQTPDGRNKILVTSPRDIYITRVLDRSDLQKSAPL